MEMFLSFKFSGPGLVSMSPNIISASLFNMCFNSLLKCIDDERIKCVGYVYSDAMTPRHWFQFADDSAIATATDEDSQHLLNVFTKWCQWSCFTIRIDECYLLPPIFKSFGIKKNGNQSVQYKPYLRISGQMIPCVEIDDVFIYLGKTFSFDMSCENILFLLGQDLCAISLVPCGGLG